MTVTSNDDKNDDDDDYHRIKCCKNDESPQGIN